MVPAPSMTPQRTCVGCRAKRPQTDLVRWALTANDTPVACRTAVGRGAWLCANNTRCLQQAIKRRGFERAWKRPVSATTHQAIEIAFEALTSSDVTNMKN